MKFPIGIQDFRKLREGGFVYVDKTEHIHRILQGGSYFFLSRPRRFGKSLLLSTLNELYSGSRELFEGLWVENHWDWEANKRPVIWLKFSSQGVRTIGLEAALHGMLDEAARALNVSLREQSYDLKFKELIIKAAENRKVALLIDEYDKPIIDYLEDVSQAEANRGILKSFYSVLKDCDPYLELVFITGVSAFSKVSIFSDLNNLENISLSPSAYTLLGITQKELEHYFPKQLAEVDVEQVRYWYNGYSWGGNEKVYNPFSILRFFKDKCSFKNYWFETGTPTFLVKEMKKQAYYAPSHTAATANDLNNFDLSRLDPVSVLFQTGYLTITHYEPQDLLYTLDYPNIEVKHSLEEILLNEYLDYPRPGALPRVVSLRNALQKKDIEAVVEIINAAFAEIPGELWKDKTEHFYHAVTHLMFSLLGAYIDSEARSARGRCDARVITDNHIYVFEFKLDGSADEALKQIEENGYFGPYADAHKEKIAVGVNFSSEQKQVAEWKVKAY